VVADVEVSMFAELLTPKRWAALWWAPPPPLPNRSDGRSRHAPKGYTTNAVPQWLHYETEAEAAEEVARHAALGQRSWVVDVAPPRRRRPLEITDTALVAVLGDEPFKLATLLGTGIGHGSQCHTPVPDGFCDRPVVGRMAGTFPVVGCSAAGSF
jgi:hypothetical protein